MQSRHNSLAYSREIISCIFRKSNVQLLDKSENCEGAQQISVTEDGGVVHQGHFNRFPDLSSPQ